MFWLAYLFTVIVGGTFAVILRALRKCSEVGVDYKPAITNAARRIANFQVTPTVLCVDDLKSELRGLAAQPILSKLDGFLFRHVKDTLVVGLPLRSIGGREWRASL